MCSRACFFLAEIYCSRIYICMLLKCTKHIEGGIECLVLIFLAEYVSFRMDFKVFTILDSEFKKQNLYSSVLIYLTHFDFANLNLICTNKTACGILIPNFVFIINRNFIVI